MQRHTLLPTLLTLTLGLALALQTGCLATVGMGASASVAPDLVYVNGVYVVEDYDRPVFYDSGFYWWYNGGVWYRSSYYDGGWARVTVSAVPVRVRRIDRPHRYVHYRAARSVRRRPAAARSVRRHRDQRTQRTQRRQVRRTQRTERRQDRRDHRQDRRDHRQERRQDRRDHRQDRRDHRQERRQDRRDHRQDRRQDRSDHRQDRHHDRRHR